MSRTPNFAGATRGRHETKMCAPVGRTESPRRSAPVWNMLLVKLFILTTTTIIIIVLIPTVTMIRCCICLVKKSHARPTPFPRHNETVDPKMMMMLSFYWTTKSNIVIIMSLETRKRCVICTNLVMIGCPVPPSAPGRVPWFRGTRCIDVPIRDPRF